MEPAGGYGLLPKQLEPAGYEDPDPAVFALLD
jgi:hypothetical protein